MKLTYEKKQHLILLNELFIIILLCFYHLNNVDTEASSILSLFVISIMLIFSAYVSFSNLKSNGILSQFSILLILNSWEFMLFQYNNDFTLKAAILLGIFINYKIVTFLMMFIFQNSYYKYKTSTNTILKIVCFVTLISTLNMRFISITLFLQWFISFGICLFLFITHKNRLIFFLKNERKNLLYTITIIAVPYLIYSLIFLRNSNYLSNSALYVIVMLPLFSILSIIHASRPELKMYVNLNFKNKALILALLLCFIFAIGATLKFNVISYFIIIHSIVFFVLLYLALTYKNILTKQNSLSINSFYNSSLKQILKEENLRKDFSNYLHDEILQDLLSIKNIVNKAEKPQIKELIIQTLDNLNISIRSQMQEYHPTILQSLTLKENFKNLLNSISERYHGNNVKINFNCDDKFFLVEPYNLIIYRILKELTTNSFKHSNCNNLWIGLYEENKKIKLIVKNDGTALPNLENINFNSHKGLSSIKEQIIFLDGTIKMSKRKPSGLCTEVNIPMKGDNSYEYFINR